MRRSIATTVACLLATLSVASESQASIKRYDLNIPRQTLDAALKDLAQQTGLQIARMSDMVDGAVMVGPVQGSLTTEQALDNLLKSQSLSYKVVNDKTIAIVNSKSETARVFEKTSWAVAQNEIPTKSEPNGAGSSSGASSDSGESTTLTEIIVTAQKLEERLPDVPIPVTAIKAETLVSNNQLRLQDYYTKIPSFTVTPTTQSSQILVIRGLTTGSGNPSVGVMIDDVPYGGSTFLGGSNVFPDLDPGDLQGIEVLRGPQGTLYGVSSLGGLFKFVTRDPSTERFSGRMQLGVSSVKNGSDPGYNIRGSVNVPVSDTLAFSASAFHRLDPGYVDNIHTGEEAVNEAEVSGGRLAGLWQLSDSFSLKLAAMSQEVKGDGVADVDVGLGDLQQRRAPGTTDYERKRQIYSAVLKGALGNAELTSVSGYNINEALTGNGTIPGAAVNGTLLLSHAKIEKFSQEVRLRISTGKLDWLFGGFYTDEDSDLVIDVNSVNVTTGQTASTLQIFSGPSKYREHAAFANLTVHFTDRFDVQFGGRQSYFEPAFSQIVTVGSTVTVTPEAKDEQSKFTYLVTPRFKLSEDTMLYARLASGYRAGGSNFTADPATVGIVIPRTYAPDETRDYELGIKSDFFDNKLTLDASVYYIDWKSIQVTLVTPMGSQSYITSGNDAKSQGVELAVQSRPFAGLTIDGWVAWSEAELAEAFPASSSVRGVRGERLPYSSPFSGNVSIEQTFPLWSAAGGFIGAEASYFGDRKGRFVAGATAVRQDFGSYKRFNLRGGVRTGPWEATLFINNLSDERGVLTGGLGAAPAVTHINIQPRTIGMSLVRSF